MQITIKNNATYAREVQYFRKNQFVVLEREDELVIKNVEDPIEISYYESLVSHGFSVEFSHDRLVTHDEVVKETTSKAPGSSDSFEEQGTKFVLVEVDLSEFSVDDLKRIVKNLGIETRARARWKLERLIQENFPRDASPEDYL